MSKPLWKHMSDEVVYIYIYIYFSYLFLRGEKAQKMSSQIWTYTYGRNVTHIYIYIYSYVLYLYIFILECVYYPLNLKMGRYWNPFQDSPIESSHTWTWILIWPGINILNSEFGIYLWSHPITYVNLRYDFNGVLTLKYTSSCPKLHIIWSPVNLQTTYL